jgi:hypothetical protein
LLHERASADVVRTLRQAGIRPILLKGPLQQAWLDPLGPQRLSSDIDILVSRDRLVDAEAALSAAGYSAAVGLVDIGLDYHSVWATAGRPPVELHWSLVGADESRVWEVLSEQTESVAIMGEHVEIPNEPARCAVIALHAAQHGIGHPPVFRDLEKALVVAESGSWHRASELATAMGAWPPFAAALSLTPRGADFLRDLGAPAPALDGRQALNLLTPPPTSLGFYFLARQHGVRAKAAFVLRKLFPSPTFMRLRYRLARRGLIGLALAYLYRPLWLVRWALPGLRSLRDARRLAKASRPKATERD